MNEFDNAIREVLDLLAIINDTAVLLKQIEFLPASQRRVLGNIQRLLKMARSKLERLPAMPEIQPDKVMALFAVALDFRDGHIDRAEANLRAIRERIDINAAMYFLDLVGQIVGPGDRLRAEDKTDV